MSYDNKGLRFTGNIKELMKYGDKVRPDKRPELWEKITDDRGGRVANVKVGDRA
jgi:hypothetical protein